MENASKALIIAGAILVAILLISVGIIVMNSINKPLNAATSEASSQAAQMYNSKFVNYAGNNKTVAEVRSLLTLIQSNNGTDKNHYIDVNYHLEDGTIKTTRRNSPSANRETIGQILGRTDGSKTYEIEIYFARDLIERYNTKI